MPTFDKGLEIFATWQTLMLGIGIYVLSFALRRVVETGWEKVKKNKWWNEVALPFTPIAIGILLALFAKKFPWPVPVKDSYSAKILYGLVCGVCCGWFYGRIRSFITAGQDEKAAAKKDLLLDSPEAPKPAPEAPKP